MPSRFLFTQVTAIRKPAIGKERAKNAKKKTNYEKCLI